MNDGLVSIISSSVEDLIFAERLVITGGLCNIQFASIMDTDTPTFSVFTYIYYLLNRLEV